MSAVGISFQFYDDFGDIELLVADYLPGSGDQRNNSTEQEPQMGVGAMSLSSVAVNRNCNVAAAASSLANAFPKSSADVLHVKESLSVCGKLASNGGGAVGEDGGVVSGLEDSDNETNPANEPPDDLLQILNM